MRQCWWILWTAAVSVFFGCSRSQSLNCSQTALGAHTAVTPVPRGDEWWTRRHQAILEQLPRKNPQVVFIGDSITHGWENKGKAVWDAYYSSYDALNLGYSGDRTEHVLWRLQNGEIDGIQPKLAVLMIGTNNAAREQYSA
ncbi:MAG: GDSL-type esterase/lipase family protein, partial [Anaerohalosphaeraceae bacterium]